MAPLPPDRQSSRRTLFGWIACVAAWLGGSVGCGTAWLREAEVTAESPLRPAAPSADAVTVEIFWANLPSDTDRFDETLWRFVQEDRLDERLRDRLIRNGLRAGVVGGAPPETIVRLLNPTRDPAAADETLGAADVAEGAADRLAEPTGVRGRTTTVRLGKPVTIIASEVYDEAIILSPDRSGKTHRGAQAIYSLRVERGPDGGYRMRLTPELHEGAARSRWDQDETGQLLFQSVARDKQAYEELRIDAPMVVGEMLLATSLPDSANSLGDYFHRADGGPGGRRKAILVRLTQAPPDPAFAKPR